MKYTITPVTETYIHSGQVQRAIARCWGYRAFSPRLNVMMAIGTMTMASVTCEIRIAK